MKTILIQNDYGIPKFKHIIHFFEKTIEEGRLKKEKKIPLINKESSVFSLSRDTLLQAYEELKKRGVIYSIPGKGYYIKSIEKTIKQRIFLLFDELNVFKENTYSSFLKSIVKRGKVDVIFHHFYIQVFKKLVNDANGNYTNFIIKPTNISDATKIIINLPVNEDYIFNQTNPELKSNHAVYQNHHKDIFDALLKAKFQLKKHNKLVMIFPDFREWHGMRKVFAKLCTEFSLHFEISTKFLNSEIISLVAFIVNQRREFSGCY